MLKNHFIKFLFLFASATLCGANDISRFEAAAPGSNQDLNTNLKLVSQSFHENFLGPYSINEDEKIKAGTKKLAALVSNSETLNNSEKVIAFAQKHRVKIAVLIKQGDDFIVVASNFMRANKLGVEGARLDHENPAYMNLKGDYGFQGKLNLWKKNYLTKVDPLKNKKGEVVGALLIAVPTESQEI